MRLVACILLLAACSTPAPAPDAADPAPAGAASQPAAKTPEARADAGATTQASKVTLTGAWIRAVPPGSTNTAMYGTLENAAPSAVEITGAASALAGSVELHTHLEEDGQMKMRQVKSVKIDGGGHHHLAPGGDHVMLIGLSSVPEAGSSHEVSLTFSDGSTLTESVTVHKEAPAGGHHHGAGHSHDGTHTHDGGEAHSHDHGAGAGHDHDHDHGEGGDHDHDHDHEEQGG